MKETVDWDNFLFRCSMLGELMTEPREKSPMAKYNDAFEALATLQDRYANTANKQTKTAMNMREKILQKQAEIVELKKHKDDVHLSATVKTYLKKVYIEQVFGREKDIHTKYMEKGLTCEEDSISLLTRVTGRFYAKNEENIQNEYICGTPDLVEDFVEDIKTSWDIWTFGDCGVTKGNYWQVMGYMWLTGKKQARLNYCLVNSPEQLIQDELRRLSWKMLMIDTLDPLYVEAEEKVRRNMEYNDIPEKLRVKTFLVNFDEDEIEALKTRIQHCREYLKTLTL